MSVVSWGLDLVFPTSIYCISCGNLIDDNCEYILCDSCREELPRVVGRTCGKCGKELSAQNEGEFCSDCLGAKHVFRKGFSCVNFSGIAKNIVRDMKYRSCAHNADAVADLMTARFSEMADRETGELPEYDLLVFAPMHEAKKEKRGYDQAELVATKFGRLIGVEVPKGVLIRTKETAVMSSLSAEERRQNLEGAFVVPEEKMEKVAGKTILLIDDVFTTGSTADACAKALKNAGAADIDIFTFAAGADYEEII